METENTPDTPPTANAGLEALRRVCANIPPEQPVMTLKDIDHEYVEDYHAFRIYTAKTRLALYRQAAQEGMANVLMPSGLHQPW